MSKRTPGPWFVAKEADAQASDGNVVISPNGYEIRPVPGVRLGDEMADLQLTAAAPELLAALQVMLRDYTAVHDIGDIEMQPAINQARSVIAKATGSAA